MVHLIVLRKLYAHNISGFLDLLDPTGVNPSQIGPDPARVKQFSEIQPPKTIKDVRSFWGFVTYLAKYCPDYEMITTTIRSLLSKNSKFCWTDSHKREFEFIIGNLSRLEFLYPYQQGNKICAMTDASLKGFCFILYQKDSKGHCSILQVGSTCLKNAQARWHSAELEL